MKTIWNRLFLVRPKAMALVLAAYWGPPLFLFAGLMVLYGLYPLGFNARPQVPELPQWRSAVLCGAAAIYGLWRASMHPAADTAYRAWLATTPWTRGLPLPRGPIQLVMQDIVFLGVLAAMSVSALKISPLVLV